MTRRLYRRRPRNRSEHGQAHHKYRKVGGSHINVGSATKGGPHVPIEAQNDNTIGGYNVPIHVLSSRKNLTGAPIHHYWNTQQILESTEGKQAVGTVLAVGSRTQWITSNGNDSNYFQAYKKFHDLAPNSLSTGSTFYTGGEIQTSRTLCLKKARVVLEITNLNSVPSTGSIYVDCAKSDTGDNPHGYWVAAYGDGKLAPLADWLIPVNAVTTDTFTASSPECPHSVLYKSKEYKKYYTQKAKLNFELAAGGRMTFNFYLDMNQVSTYASTTSNGNLAFMKGSVLFTVAATGHPVFSTVNDTMVYGIQKIGITASVFATFFNVEAKTTNPTPTFTAAYKLEAGNASTTQFMMDADTNAEANPRIVTG